MLAKIAQHLYLLARHDRLFRREARQAGHTYLSSDKCPSTGRFELWPLQTPEGERNLSSQYRSLHVFSRYQRQPMRIEVFMSGSLGMAGVLDVL